MDTVFTPALISSLWTCFVLALVASGTSVTITRTEVFEPLRNWTAAKSAWFGKLIHCFYCTSHWITFFLVAIYRPTLVSSGVFFIDLAVTAFFMIVISTFSTGLIAKSFFVIMTTFMAQEKAKEEMAAKKAAAGHAK